jgi:hypothetical protein
MDHVFSEEELQRYGEHMPDIPWLGYDHQPSEPGDYFEDYALHRGWSQQQLHWLKDGKLGNLDTDKLKPFLQSWFSIGLYETALGKSLSKDAFISRGNSVESASFTSEPLRHLLQDWAISLEHSSVLNEPVQSMERIIRVLTAASTWNRMISDPTLFIQVNQQFCDEQYHSVMRLSVLSGMALQTTADHLAVAVEGDFRPRLQKVWLQTNHNEHLLHGRLIQRGWCPYVQSVLLPYGTLMTEYAAVIGPPLTLFAHDACSPEACVRHNIDEITYKTTHIQDNCECEFLQPDLTAIAKVLGDGQIPLMDLDTVPQSGQKNLIRVVPFEPHKNEYTAVSHVWSGGLGSTSEKGLPKCAISWLAGLIRSTNGQKLIWIDSLCIPSEKRLRKISIVGMNRVYKEAANTLILDPELIHTPSASTQEMLLWITTASWMQRMWTLPEGRLSQNRWFAFSDRVVRFADLSLESNQNDTKGSLTSSLILQLAGLFLESSNVLRYIHQSLCYRTTSKAEDEVPALATLFGIDTQRIIETESLDERMAAFWIALREKVGIPMNILFLNGAKLPIPGLRWAPRSLLNAGKQLSLLAPPSGVDKYNVFLSSNGTLTAKYVVIYPTARLSFKFGKANPIKLVFVPAADSDALISAPFIIMVMHTIGSQEEHHGAEEVLEGVDALAVNVTNLAAQGGHALALELASAKRSALALSLADDEGQPKSSHLFRARRRVEVWPLRWKDDNIPTAQVGWVRISIS